MMCGRLLRHAEIPANWLTRWFNNLVAGTVEGYRRSLEWVLRRQTLTLAVTGVTLGATLWLYVIIPKGFLPPQDTGLVMAVTEGGPAVSFAEMTRLQERIVEKIRQDPDVTGVVSLLGVSPLNATPNTGHLEITLGQRGNRKASVGDVIERLKLQVAQSPGMVVYFQPVQDVQISSRASRGLYQYTLSGTNAQAVSSWSAKLVDRLRSEPLLRDVASEAQEGGLRSFINVNRETAGRLGLSMQVIIDTLNDAFGQRQISTIYAQTNQYRVVLEAAPEYQRDPSSLSKLFVPSTNGSQVPVSAFTTLERTTAPLVISHQAQFPADTISFNLAPGAALSDALRVINTCEHDIGMPLSIARSYAGDAAEFSRSLAGEPWLILAAVAVIYIVLGVLYESFIHPLTILSTLPSAGVGALLALILCGRDLSIVALIGIVLLMGIVKKNAIMMIDFALQAERREKMSPTAAIIKASALRFRPIMMTTVAALFGALPLALEHGTGSELRFPLGVTIIGGLMLSQLLTLYTTPVIYLAMGRLRARFAGGVTRPTASSPRLIERPAE
jgi:multidrug efflux pump